MMKYRADIDGLRALAVLLVVAFHATPDIVAKGFIGVDIFFVISGYLITSIIVDRLISKKFSIWWFLGRRMKRLFPALMLVMLSVLSLGWFSLLAEEYELLGKHVVGGAFFVANFLFAAELGHVDVAAVYKPLVHLWSLAVEEQFYMIFPILLTLLYVCRLNISACLLVVAVCSFLYGLHEVAAAPARAFFLPFARFWELLAGGVLACATLRWGADIPDIWRRADRHLSGIVARVGRGPFPGICAATVVSGIGFLFIASALFLVPDGAAYPGMTAMLPVAGAFFIILAGPQAWFNHVLLMNRPAIWFGLISYPLYLWHWPILSFMAIIYGELPHRDARLIAVCSSVLLAWLTYQFVENPIRKHNSQTLLPIMLVLGVMLVAIGGGYVYLTGGASDRQWLRAELLYNSSNQQENPELKRGENWICPSLDKDNGCESTGDEPSIVVIGDSHAPAAYSILLSAYRDSGVDIGFIGRAGCPPLFDVISHEPRRKDTRKCVQNMGYFLSMLFEQKHVEHIVLASRIALYVNGSGFGEREISLSGWVLREQGSDKDKDRIDVFFDALHDTVRRAQEAGKRVSIIHGTPELGFDIKSCAPLRPYVMKLARKQCAIKRSEFEKRTRAYRERLTGFLREHPEVGSADISSALCDAELCYGADEGILYYMDDDQLGGRGVLYVSEHVARQLGELTGRNPGGQRNGKVDPGLVPRREGAG